MTDESQQGRAVVTYGRSLIALMIAQSLGPRGIDIIGCDSVDLTVLSFSKFVSKNFVYTPPAKCEGQFIEDLLRIVKQNKPDDGRPYVLIPAFDDAKVIARHRDRFKDHIIVACADYEAIDRVHPKDHFAATTSELDLESPKTWMPKDESELAQCLEEIEFPVFIKPPNDVGGRGVSKQSNKSDLQAAFQELSEQYPGEQILIQSLADGLEYCFCGLFDQGKLIASMVYHNLQKFPLESGPGVVRETVDSDRFDAIAKKLMKPLTWHGVVEIDFMWDEHENSTPIMIEVNPRFWQGLDHSIESDVDFPWLLYQLFVSGHVESDDEAIIGQTTIVPGLSTMARLEGFVGEALNFDDLEKKWPEIRKHLKRRNLAKAAELFKDALGGSFSLNQAVSKFGVMLGEAEEADKISYSEDDPLIALGVLYVLASLVRHGELPPEIRR